MSYNDLVSFEKDMDKLFPFHNAEEWDNVGLQIANSNNIIKKVLITLDLNIKVINFAIKEKFNLILAHHPLIFKPLKKIVAIDDYLSILIKNLVTNNIAFLCLHTNLDKFFNKLLSQKIGLKKIKPLSPDGIGSYGFFPKPMSLKAFLDRVKEKLKLNDLTYTGDESKRIKGVACVGGGGGSYFNHFLKAKKIDLFLTADVRYHTACYADEIGLPIVDAGHYYTENIMLDELKKILDRKYRNEIFFEVSKINTNPLKYN